MDYYKILSGFLILVIISSSFLQKGMYNDRSNVQQEKIEQLVKYLLSNYNENIGLIYETDSTGKHYLGGQFPWVNNITNDRIFWLFSDNLLASYAIEKYNSCVATEIRRTLNSYGYNETHNSSNFWEALFGYDIPDHIKSGKNYAVHYKERDYAILANLNNCTDGLDWKDYGGSLIIKSLDCLWQGEKEQSIKYYKKALELFNGTGVNDRAAKEDKYFITFKLSMILYASKILGLSTPKTIEETLWSMQNHTSGGIITLTYFNGQNSSSCNSETASLTLLAYNDELIQSLRMEAGLEKSYSKTYYPILVIVVILILYILFESVK